MLWLFCHVGAATQHKGLEVQLWCCRRLVFPSPSNCMRACLCVTWCCLWGVCIHVLSHVLLHNLLHLKPCRLPTSQGLRTCWLTCWSMSRWTQESRQQTRALSSTHSHAQHTWKVSGLGLIDCFR